MDANSSSFSVYDLKITTGLAFSKRLNKVVFCCSVKQGRRAAKDYAFTSREDRTAFLELQRDKAEQRQARKMSKQRERKAAIDAKRAEFKVGTILANSWGYDQTNVDFYQVVEVSSSGASVKLQEIASQRVEGTEANMSCKLTPLKDQFAKDSAPFRKIIGQWGISFDHGGCSIAEEGSEHYCSWYH